MNKDIVCLVDIEKGEVCWDNEEEENYSVNNRTISNEDNDDEVLVAVCPNSACTYAEMDYTYDQSDGYCPECGGYLCISEAYDSEILNECTRCGVICETDELLADRGCPMCGESTIRVARGTKIGESVTICPNPMCNEANHIIDSTESIGDSECCRCGAIWDSMNDKEAIMYKQDVHSVWLQRQEFLSEGE
jgi:predicted RNA-binding Zn-ribbon protein involved in translation (DUF1610 family)